jgi:TPR repeat protein
MYYEGVLFEQDYKKAAEIYSKLSYALDMNRCYRFYLMCRDGIGMEKNAEKAEIFLRRAAIKGHREARRALGMKP